MLAGFHECTVVIVHERNHRKLTRLAQFPEILLVGGTWHSVCTTFAYWRPLTRLTMAIMDLVTTPAIMDSLNMAMSMMGGGAVPDQPGHDLAVMKVYQSYNCCSFLWNNFLILCRWEYCWPWPWPRYFLGWSLWSSSLSSETTLTPPRGAGTFIFRNRLLL